MFILAFAAASSVACATPLHVRFRHARHLFGDAVCFLLIYVSRSVYHKLRLETYWRFGEHGCPTDTMGQASCCKGIETCSETFCIRLEQSPHSLITSRTL